MPLVAAAPVAAAAGGMGAGGLAALWGGLGLSAAGLGFSMFGGGSRPGMNIGLELEKISKLYEHARQVAIENVNQEALAGRTQQVSNLAARGTYRSPVAQNVFNALEAARLQAISKVGGQLAAQEAGTRAQMMGTYAGYQMQNQQLDAQRNAGIAGGLASFGGGIMGLGMSMYRPATPTAAPATAYTGPMSQGWGQAPLVPNSPMAFPYQGPPAPQASPYLPPQSPFGNFNPGYSWWGNR